MKIKIINYPENYKDLLYLAGRNCYGLEEIKEKTTKRSIDKFIYKLINNKHESVLEHCNISIYIKDVSRSLLAQLTRHRLCAYSVKSQHFVKHNNFKYKQLETKILHGHYNKLMANINNFYDLLLKLDVPHYIAREVLPNSCLTNIFITTNVRQYRHIIKTRITFENTPEIQKLAHILLRELYMVMPELFFDLVDKYEDDRPDLIA